MTRFIDDNWRGKDSNHTKLSWTTMIARPLKPRGLETRIDFAIGRHTNLYY